MIEIAVCILAIVGVIRIIQNGIQLNALKKEQTERSGIYDEFIDSINKSNLEWVREMLETYKDKFEEDSHERL